MRLSLARTVGAGLVATLLLACVAALSAWLPSPLATLAWSEAHRAVALAGAVLPGFYFLTALVADPFLPKPIGRSGDKAAATMAGALLLAVGSLVQPSSLFGFIALAGILLVLFGAVLHFLSLRDLPRAGLADVARDPLTKGDDACVMHLRLGAMFLMLGLLLRALTYVPYLSGFDWAPRLGLAGDHLLLVGYGLPTLYGLSHLLVPRLSGVPAIAAGAIKGELHSTMLGVLLLALGFAFSVKALLITGGLVVFFGAFVWMGVLGANIMKNKSRTQRVTPGFAYIPWVFAGVLWIVLGVLLGLFLNILPALFADKLPALRSLHVHLLLFGGALQLGLGLAARAAVPEPVPFSQHRWAFWLLNVALGLFGWGALADSATGLAASALLALLGLAAWFFPLVRRAAPVKA